ncbi:hypothetical protein [Brevundimonas sp. NPDC046655]|uniref:hypothetical protein n=1 Tax=unclassified Brevundimonas TaxID=2622653 RepID=UPI0038507ED8
MAQIEREALEVQVVERLAILLSRTGTPGHDYATTEALAYFTTILAWVMHRVKKPDDRVGQSLRKQWSSTGAIEEPWLLPEHWRGKSAFDALDDLRNASAHAGLRSSEPINDSSRHCLAGFKLGGTGWAVDLPEEELRRIGDLVATRFVASYA